MFTTSRDDVMSDSWTLKNLSLKVYYIKNAGVLYMNCNSVVIADRTRM
jgi:hypothetical protein